MALRFLLLLMFMFKGVFFSTDTDTHWLRYYVQLATLNGSNSLANYTLHLQELFKVFVLTLMPEQVWNSAVTESKVKIEKVINRNHNATDVFYPVESITSQTGKHTSMTVWWREYSYVGFS